MQRELVSLPLPPFVRSKLSSSGFITVEDIINLKPSEIDKGACICCRCLISFYYDDDDDDDDDDDIAVVDVG